MSDDFQDRPGARHVDADPPPGVLVGGRVSRGDLIGALDWLEWRLQERENQTDLATLEYCAATIRGVLGFLGVSFNVLANLVGITDRKAVRQWVSGKATPRHGALMVMRMLVESLVEPPRMDGDGGGRGVGTAAEALWPLLDALESRSELAGWQNHEIAEAVAAWAGRRGFRL